MKTQQQSNFGDRQLQPIFYFVFLAFLGATSLNSILPSLIYQTSNSINRELLYGIIVAAFPFGQCLGVYFLSKIVNVLGHRATLIISSALSFVFSCLFSLAIIHGMLIWAILFRFLTGCWEGNVVLSRRFIVNSISNEHQKNANLRKISIAVSTGFLLGPLLNAYIFSYCKYVAIFFPSISSLLMTLIALGFKVFPHKLERITEKINQNDDLSIKSVNTKIVWIICLSLYFSSDFFYQYIPLFLTLKFQFSAIQIAKVLFCTAFAHIFSSYISHLPKKFLTYDQILWPTALTSIFNMILINFLSPPYLLLAFCFQGLIISMLTNNLTYFFSNQNFSYDNTNSVIQQMISARAFVSGITAFLGSFVVRLGFAWPFMLVITSLAIFISFLKIPTSNKNYLHD